MGSTSGVIFLIIAFTNSILCNSNVPVLIWNSNQSNDVSVPAVSALQQLNIASLQARYFDQFRPDNILLFLQDTLSIEDLSSHSKEMKHVNKYMESSHSLYLPNVVEPSMLQHDLVQQGYKVTTLSARTAVAGLKLDRVAKEIIVVKLPPTRTSPIRSRALRKSDEVIQSVISKIGDMADFTVIYTALKPSVEPSEVGVAGASERVRVSRSLSQHGEAGNPSNFYNGTCVLLYLRQNMLISLTGSSGNHYEIPESTESQKVLEDCLTNQSIQSIQLNFDNVELGETNYYKLKVRFQFTRSGSYWRSPTAEVTLYKDSSSTGDKRPLQLTKWTDDSVPVGWSYACNVPIKYREVGKLSNATDIVELIVPAVQVEAFTLTPWQFHNAWDCVGFFSIGIWAGLLASLLAVIILTVGLYMLADIKTMDRFDDPKGKCIMVPQTQD